MRFSADHDNKRRKCLEARTAVEKGQEEGMKLMVVCFFLCIFFVSFLKHGEGN